MYCYVKTMDVTIPTLCDALFGAASAIFVNWLGNCKSYKNIDSRLGKLDHNFIGLVLQLPFYRTGNHSFNNILLEDQVNDECRNNN